jgi:hypothetical protein
MKHDKLDSTNNTIVNDKNNVIYIEFLNKKGKQNEIVKRQKIFLSNMLQLDKYSGRTDANAIKFIEKYKRINKARLDEIYKIRHCAKVAGESLVEYAPYVAYEIQYSERIDILKEDIQKHYDIEQAIRVDTEEGMEQAIDTLLGMNEELATDIFLSRIEMMPTEKIKSLLNGTAECIGFNLVEEQKITQLKAS